jgi:hypothetical protein
MLIRALTLLTLLCSFTPTALAYYDEFSFRSSTDSFTLKKQNDGIFYLDQQKVKLGTFNDFISLFGKSLESICPNLQSPDLTITARRTVVGEFESKTSETVRKFFLKDKIVQGDGGCAPIEGDGVYYLPLHRFWFVGAETLSLIPKKSLKIESSEGVLVSAEIAKGQWAAPQTPGLNWDVFNSFLGSLKNFSVFARLHPEIGNGKTKVTLFVDGQKHDAFLVAKNLWAIQVPKSQWLVASGSWSKWEDMRAEMWQDRFFEKVQIFSDKAKKLEEREAAIESLGTQWSVGIKFALQQVVTDANEPSSLRSSALKRLRQRPSDDNFSAMITALQTTEDKDLLIELTRNLRIKNPKGPLIKDTGSEEEDQATIRTWVNWWKQNGPKNP